MATLRELSKQEFISTVGNTNESISTGALQRIADATELMAKNYIKLQDDAAMYKRWYNESREQKEKLYRQISALKGVITELKNKAK